MTYLAIRYGEKWFWSTFDGKDYRNSPPCDRCEGHPTRERSELHFYIHQTSVLESVLEPVTKLKCLFPLCESEAVVVIKLPLLKRHLCFCGKHRTSDAIRLTIPLVPGKPLVYKG